MPNRFAMSAMSACITVMLHVVSQTFATTPASSPPDTTRPMLMDAIGFSSFFPDGAASYGRLQAAATALTSAARARDAVLLLRIGELLRTQPAK
jgi:hypothetical protein